jgi:hypothetical protein
LGGGLIFLAMLVRLCEEKFNSDGLTIGQGTGEVRIIFYFAVTYLH